MSLVTGTRPHSAEVDAIPSGQPQDLHSPSGPSSRDSVNRESPCAHSAGALDVRGRSRLVIVAHSARSDVAVRATLRGVASRERMRRAVEELDDPVSCAQVD